MANGGFVERFEREGPFYTPAETRALSDEALIELERASAELADAYHREFARAERLQGALEEIAGFEDGNRGFDEMGYRELARAALDQEEPKGGEAVGCLGSDSRPQALATRPPLSLDQEEAEGVDPGLVDPEEAAKHLTESERQAYRDSQQSIVNASRGTGLRESAESSEPCPRCEGRGSAWWEGDMQHKPPKPCEVCKGTGLSESGEA